MIPKKHQLKCSNCGQIIDMRDLSQVFAHEDCGGVPVDDNRIKQVLYSGSREIEEPVFWTKDKKKIDLN